MNSETREAMSAITAANEKLMEMVQAQQRDIAALKAREVPTPPPYPGTENSVTAASDERMFAMIKKLAEVMKGTTNSCGRRTDKKPPKELFYCWSHGFGTNPKHTSCQCTKEKEGHIDRATKRNRQGGSIMNAKHFKFSLD